MKRNAAFTVSFQIAALSQTQDNYKLEWSDECNIDGAPDSIKWNSSTGISSSFLQGQAYRVRLRDHTSVGSGCAGSPDRGMQALRYYTPLNLSTAFSSVSFFLQKQKRNTLLSVGVL